MQQELNYIYQVYKCGSFSKAAEKLFLTQPALSISIQKIEASLGMPLFDRSRRPLKLTQAGETYIEMIEKELNLEADLTRQIHDIKDSKTGFLRIGGSHYLNAYILPYVLSGFNKEYPGIKLELEEYSSDQLSEMLTDRKIDMTFSCNPTFTSNFEKYPAFYDHILLAIPSEMPINELLSEQCLSAADIISGKHLEKSCPVTPLTRFKDLEFILLSSGNNLHDRCLQMFCDAGFEPKIKLILSQLVTAYHLAEHQLAATFISDRLVRTATTKLCFYKIDSPQTERLFYMLLPNRHYTSHAVKAFVQYFLVNF